MGRVPTELGKQGKWPKTFPVRENTGNLEILPKTQGKQGIWFAQVLNSLIIKVKYISKFAAKISNSKEQLDKSAKSVMYAIATNHINWHRENLPSDREITGKTQGISKCNLSGYPVWVSVSEYALSSPSWSLKAPEMTMWF